MIPSLIFLTANSLSNSTPQSPNPSTTLRLCRHFAGADALLFCDPAGGRYTDCGWKRGAEGRMLGSHVCPGLTPLDFMSRQHDRQLIGESGICQDTSSVNSHYFSSFSASLLPFPHTSPPPPTRHSQRHGHVEAPWCILPIASPSSDDNGNDDDDSNVSPLIKRPH